MYLNKQEQQILEGKSGQGLTFVFSSQIQIEEFFEAEKLSPTLILWVKQ